MSPGSNHLVGTLGSGEPGAVSDFPTTRAATHTALFYAGARHYAAESGGFLREGLERGHRSLVLAPARRVDLLRSTLGRDADEVTFVEDTVAYAPQWNVYRVLLDFAAAAPDTRTTMLAEQSLGRRLAAELVDYRRLEAAINLVFAEHDVDLLCPYDVATLPTHLVDIGTRTHGAVRAHGQTSPNPHSKDPADLLAALAEVVPPPADAVTLDCTSTSDVSSARRLVRSRGADAGLDPEAVDDVALAISEVLSNALLHGAPPVRLHVYSEVDTWVCHVQDAGRGPVDLIAGLLPPSEPAENGYGLWLARQLCAAVDVGNDGSGTHVRLHTRLP